MTSKICYGKNCRETKLAAGMSTTYPQVLKPASQQAVFRVLIAISFSHLLNDMMQSLIPAVYPLLKSSFHLSFAQIGVISLSNQLTASLLQSFSGSYTDRRPQPYSLPIGMSFTLLGLLIFSIAVDFRLLLVAAAMVGMGS